MHLRPGHYWLFELGDAGDGSSFDRKKFALPGRTWEKYKGVRFTIGKYHYQLGKLGLVEPSEKWKIRGVNLHFPLPRFTE